jgi:phosphoribosylglycinamide formyltransferase-1
MNLGFLSSHHGSNLQALLDACRTGRVKARPAVVISNNADSEALRRAEREGIPRYHLSSRTHPEPEQLDTTIAQALERHHTDLVVLAGYMRKLGPKTLARYQGRIINIHPALLPQYGGQGMYGMNVHRAVIAAGEKETGVTIHGVDAEYDHGPIIAQCRVPVFDGDTAESLAQRVLVAEHELLVATVAEMVDSFRQSAVLSLPIQPGDSPRSASYPGPGQLQE